MDKLPNSLIKSFWSNLTSEWRAALRASFSLSDSFDISEIQNMLNSTNLFINTNAEEDDNHIDLKQINAIKYFTELEYILLQNTTIDSLVHLKDIKNLKSLRLMNCNIIDSSHLAYLVQLEELSIWNCNIQNTNSIKELINLKKLDIIDTEIIDIRNLSELRYLTDLNCWSSHLYDSQLDIIKLKNPKCKINELKQSFEFMDFMNNNPEAEMSDFGYHTIDLTVNNNKWTFDDAPIEVKEQMLVVKEDIYNYLELLYYPKKYNNENSEQDRIKINIDNIEYFVISSNYNRKPIIHFIGCEYWDYIL